MMSTNTETKGSVRGNKYLYWYKKESREDNKVDTDKKCCLIKHHTINSNGEWRLNSTYSQYLHYLENSSHFIFRSFVMEHSNARTDVWRPGWVIAAIWTLTGKSLAVVYRQEEACSTTNMILRRGHRLLLTWQIIRQGEMLATDNMEWANISSLIRVSLGQGPCVWECHCRQYCAAETEDSISNWGRFLHLANRLL
jgi:hypothetical protein